MLTAAAETVAAHMTEQVISSALTLQADVEGDGGEDQEEQGEEGDEVEEPPTLEPTRHPKSSPIPPNMPPC